jgi:hypothetical protein
MVSPGACALTQHILFLFLDGIGLGEDDSQNNPFAVARMPNLSALTGGKRWLRGIDRVESERAIFIPTDPNLGIDGKPQSATGQAAILTGLNVSRQIGYHYGPKPNREVAAIVRAESLFVKLAGRGLQSALINAYPQRYFDGINSGKRLLSVVPLAVTAADLPLFDHDALLNGQAMSADFTGEGWRTQLGYESAPVYTPARAGAHLAGLARQRHFTFFEHWPTDILGHRGTVEQAVAHLETFDRVMGGLLDAWDDSAGLIVLTSDHGNMEDMSQRGHTTNLVPTLLVGEARHAFAQNLSDLTHFAPAILRLLDGA